MKYLLVILFFFCGLNALFAQEKHFIFIQSDNNQPFYVYLNGKLYSSTATGYVIIPKIADGSYNFSVGFAKNAFPEQNFQYVIDKKDLGFDLKNLGDKGWGLFNLQSLAVTIAQSGNTDNVTKALGEKTVSRDDTDPVISFNKKKKVVKTPDKSTVDSLQNQPLSESEKEKAGAEKSGTDVAVNGVKKLSETMEPGELHLAYLEGDDKKGDTIHIIIPSDKTITDMNNNSNPATVNSGDTNTGSANTASPGNAAKDTLQFLDMNLDRSKKDTTGETAGQPKATAIANSKCNNNATPDDYAHLRRKMAMETTDEKMINAARKMYKNKCFTTIEIKKLSTLFLSDEGRYNFFNASYNSVSDPSEYSSLQSEFIDPAFADRFKVMLKQDL